MNCNNISNCHNPKVIADNDNATRVICQECKQQFVIRKDWRGIHENRQYSKIYKRDILQPKDNLFYKHYDQYLLK